MQLASSCHLLIELRPVLHIPFLRIKTLMFESHVEQENILQTIFTNVIPITVYNTSNLISKDCILNVSEVEDVFSRLKPHKSDGSLELATDHFINGGRDCLSLVAF